MANKKKFENKILILILIFAILSLSIVPVLARENNSVTVHLKDFSKDEFIVGRSLKLWKVSDTILRDNLNDRLKDLENISEDDLDKKYDSLITDPSDENGIINISNLSDGTYYAREILKGNETSHIYSFFIFLPLSDEDSKDIFPKSTGDNPPDNPPGNPPEVELIKVSENGDRLKDAVFELYENSPDGVKRVPLKDNAYDANGSLDELLKTDENGEIHLKLPPGNYIFREIKAPDGYEIANRDTFFEVKSSGKTVVTIVNKKDDHRSGYKFLKIDGETKEVLGGASFKVTKKVGDSYEAVVRDGKDYIVTSNSRGEFSVTNLEYGTYYLWEIKAPYGYKLLNGSIEFEIGKDSDFNRKEIENERNPLIPNENVDNPPNSSNTSANSPKRFTKGEIPKTGDITLIVLTISGIVLTLVGLSLIKKDTSK